ncbi:Holliday junction resolvase RuvX [Actinorhabdospora filicis]|uniref:Holliday junction resolvase RuvX n=1 Tax=Actinorhabdospora filicis TaxID=1785913 RepID=UPI002557546A|nr:Holliday junction resolvase RuvX [Actinorhabdospora filicis]
MTEIEPPTPAPEFRRGRRLSVDVGKVRVGVAMSDPDCVLASPVETVPRDLSTKKGVPADIATIAALVDEHDVVEIIVGLPVTLAGEESHAARDARHFARLLGRSVESVPVRMVDERLTTAVASRRLAERGVKGHRRKAVVDQAAAVEILQLYLERMRRT